MELLSSFGGEGEERGPHCCCNNLLGYVLVKEYMQTWPQEMHCPLLYLSMLLAIKYTTQCIPLVQEEPSASGCLSLYFSPLVKCEFNVLLASDL